MRKMESSASISDWCARSSRSRSRHSPSAATLSGVSMLRYSLALRGFWRGFGWYGGRRDFHREGNPLVTAPIRGHIRDQICLLRVIRVRNRGLRRHIDRRRGAWIVRPPGAQAGPRQRVVGTYRPTRLHTWQPLIGVGLTNAAPGAQRRTTRHRKLRRESGSLRWVGRLPRPTPNTEAPTRLWARKRIVGPGV